MGSNSLSPPVQKAYYAEILLNKPIFNPGESVEGQVLLRLTRKLRCDAVSIQLYGSARVFFVRKTTKPGALIQPQAFEQKKVLVDRSENLWLSSNHNVQKQLTLDEIARKASSTAIQLPHERENSSELGQGDHSFSFSIPLPSSGIYTSFDANGSAGCIRYYLMLKIFNGSCIVLRKKLLFAVICPKVVNSYPLSKTEQVITQRKDFKKGFYLLVELSLKKHAFVPGEPIEGDIMIENKSSKSVKYACLQIVQNTICYSNRPEIQIYESSFKTAGMGLPVDKLRVGEQLRYPIRFNVPALIPDVDVLSCIETSYLIQLEVGFARGISKHIPVPISIGTHLQPMSCQQLSAPPSYEDIDNQESYNYQLSPPDYNTSILGMSALECEDQHDYTPLCYHYNFAYSHNDDKVEEKKQ